MPSISLQDIQEAADKKFGPFVVEGVPGGDVTLANPLRMSKDKRKKLFDLKDVTEENIDEKFADLIRLGTSPAEAKRLLAAIGDDLATLKEIVESWLKGSQAGEA